MYEALQLTRLMSENQVSAHQTDTVRGARPFSAVGIMTALSQIRCRGEGKRQEQALDSLGTHCPHGQHGS